MLKLSVLFLFACDISETTKDVTSTVVESTIEVSKGAVDGIKRGSRKDAKKPPVQMVPLSFRIEKRFMLLLILA